MEEFGLESAGRVVGNETDSFPCHNEIYEELVLRLLQSTCTWGAIQGYLTQCPPDPAPFPVPEGPRPDTFPYSQFVAPTIPVNLPFSVTGQVVVLARGDDFNPACAYNTLSFCAPILALTDPLQVDFAASDQAGGNKCYGTTATGQDNQGHGSIVYYHHTGGGRVLSLGSIDAPRGLVVPEKAGTNEGSQLRYLVREVFDCMLDEQFCGDRLGDPVYPQVVARPQAQIHKDDPQDPNCGVVEPTYPFPYQLSCPGDILSDGDLLIVEIMDQPNASDDEEWIEIYNNTSTPIALHDLTLWIDGELSVLSTSQVLAPGGLAVVARDSNGVIDGALPASTILVDLPGFKLESTGEIEIRTMRTNSQTQAAEDALVCRLVYDSGSNFPTATAGSARAYDMDLSGTLNSDDVCLLRDGGKWCLSSTPYGLLGEFGTPGLPNICP